MRIESGSKLAKSLIVSLLACAPIARAQTFGANTQETIIPAQSWAPMGGGYQFAGGGSITPSADGVQTWVAPVGVPSGAVVTAVDFFLSDTDPGSDIVMTAYLSTFPVGGVGSCGGYFAIANSSALNGLGTITMTAPYGSFPINYRGSCNNVDSYLNYYLAVQLSTTAHTLWGARVSWNRTVSSPPGSPTFNDVSSGDLGFQYIEALAASGITGGCGGGNYCPDNPVTRRQMAIFLAKALGLYYPQ